MVLVVMSYRLITITIITNNILGMPAYIKFFKSIISKISPNYPFILVEMPYVSMHISPNVPSIDEHVLFLKQVLNKHNYRMGHFVGHSWGMYRLLTIITCYH